MGCGSSREVATASSNNVFQKEVIAYILAEQPNGAIPQSEVARLTLCRGLHSHFRTQHMLQKLWRSYSNYNTCPTDASTMSFLQLQALILDLLLCDKDHDRILHERHMTGDKSSVAANPIAPQTTHHQIALSIGLRNSQDKFVGYLNFRNTKIKQIIKNDAKLVSLCKKVFKNYDGRLERKKMNNDVVVVIPETGVTETTFVQKFRIDGVIDVLGVKM